MNQDLFLMISIYFLPGILAITLHEAAHALAAYRLGDATAYYLGRVSLNPFKHVDPIGTFAVPLLLMMMRAPFMFGWANPVPVNTRLLKKPKLYSCLIALAGPAANLLMAISWALILKSAILMQAVYSEPVFQWLVSTSKFGVSFNVILLVFNLLPIPPLDGSKCLSLLLPYPLNTYYENLEPYGFLIIMALLLSGLLSGVIFTAQAFFLSIIGSLLF